MWGLGIRAAIKDDLPKLGIISEGIFEQRVLGGFRIQVSGICVGGTAPDALHFD